jgi:aryl-alcohol dehydrogenase-like predicted oxidoreductase
MPTSDAMRRRTLPKTDLVVSSICYGAMGCGTRVVGAEVERILDTFVDRGGNFFDTAHCYAFWVNGGFGASERSLGQYLEDRGTRGEMVVATKGAHPPVEGYRDRQDWMTPECVRDDLDDSLERLRTDYIDLYWLHRDNPSVPVGEIVDLLNDEVQRGRIRYFGGSNWRVSRLREANRYAAKNGKMGFVASQPSWSLAWTPPFTNDQVAVDDIERTGYEEAGDLAIIPYNSTGTGFFATAGEKGKGRYGNETSAERLARCQSLAKELEASPNQIALAWLMHQRAMTIPIIGTCNYNHLVDALDAATIELSRTQVDFLSAGRA